MTLRPYQSDAYHAVLREFLPDGLPSGQSTLIVEPTGTGKTHIFAHVAKAMLPYGRVMVIAHREELIWQAKEKVEAVIPGIAVDVEQAENKALEHDPAPVVVASVQTLHAKQNKNSHLKRKHKFNPQDFSLLIPDEAHHTPANTWRQIIEYFRRGNPSLCVLGATATPDRLDKIGLGTCFDSVAHQYELKEAIDDGWLVPIRQQTVILEGIDFKKVRSHGGDFIQAQLAAEMEQEKPLHGVVSTVMQEVPDKKCLIFTAGVRQAERLAEIFNREDPCSAEFVTGKTPRDKRRAMLRRFKHGDFKRLCNVGVALEGFDEPSIDVVAMARPTKSRAVYAQGIGRGTRTLPGVVGVDGDANERRMAIRSSSKPVLRVLDFTDGASTHKLITSMDILAGDMPPEIVQRAKKMAEGLSEPVDPETLLELAERDHLREEQRRVIRAKARYRLAENSPFRLLDIQPPAAHDFSQRIERPLSEAQMRVMKKAKISADELRAMPLHEQHRLVGVIIERDKAGLATLPQVRFFKRQGIDASKWTRREANQQMGRKMVKYRAKS